MKRRLGLTLTAGLAIGLGFWIAFDGGPSSESRSVKPIASELNLGIVENISVLTHSIAFVNDGVLPVVVDHFTASCTCTNIEYKPRELKPGEQDVVHISIDLARIRSSYEGKAFRIRLTPVVADHSLPSWLVHGMFDEQKAELVIREQLFEIVMPFSEVTIGDLYIPSYSCTTDKVEVESLDVQFSFRCAQISESRFVIYMKPLCPEVGLNMASLRILFARDGVTREEFESPIACDVMPNIKILPSRLDFATVAVGHESTRQLVLSIQGPEKVYVADLLLPEFVSLHSLQPRNRDNMRFVAKPAVKGLQEATVRILLRGESMMDECMLSIPCAVLGTDPNTAYKRKRS